MSTFTKEFESSDEFVEYCKKLEVREVFHNTHKDVFMAVPPKHMLTTLIFNLRPNMVPRGWGWNPKKDLKLRRTEESKRDSIAVLNELGVPEDQIKRFRNTKFERNMTIDEDEQGGLHIHQTEKGVHFEFRGEGFPAVDIIADVNRHNERKVNYSFERAWDHVIKMEREVLTKKLKDAKMEVWHGSLARGHQGPNDVDYYEED